MSRPRTSMAGLAGSPSTAVRWFPRPSVAIILPRMGVAVRGPPIDPGRVAHWPHGCHRARPNGCWRGRQPRSRHSIRVSTHQPRARHGPVVDGRSIDFSSARFRLRIKRKQAAATVRGSAGDDCNDCVPQRETCRHPPSAIGSPCGSRPTNPLPPRATSAAERGRALHTRQGSPEARYRVAIPPYRSGRKRGGRLPRARLFCRCPEDGPAIPEFMLCPGQPGCSRWPASAHRKTDNHGFK